MNHDLLGIRKTDSYHLYSSPFVIDNQSTIIEIADRAHILFKENFKDRDSTWTYHSYNLFSLTAGNPYTYIIFQQLVAAIRDWVGDSRPLWMQCWLNYHSEGEVLDWHHHDNNFLAHGYLSVDPKDTVTEFKQFTIENRVGNIYVGKPGDGMEHRVVVRRPYSGRRITLAFDVIDSSTNLNNLSFIPI